MTTKSLLKYPEHKKVLLRERKRHTARRVASARYATLGGGGTPSSHGGWGVPHPVMVGGGTISSHGWGVVPRVPSPTIQTWPGGTPSSHCGGWGGVTPSSHGGWGVPYQVMVGGTISSHGYPVVPPHHPDLARGYPIQSWWGGYPGYPPHYPDLARGYPRYPPPSRPGRGDTPLTIQTWLGGRVPQGTPPPSRCEMGYPPLRPEMGYPPT